MWFTIYLHKRKIICTWLIHYVIPHKSHAFWKWKMIMKFNENLLNLNYKWNDCPQIMMFFRKLSDYFFQMLTNMMVLFIENSSASPNYNTFYHVFSHYKMWPILDWCAWRVAFPITISLWKNIDLFISLNTRIRFAERMIQRCIHNYIKHHSVHSTSEYRNAHV